MQAFHATQGHGRGLLDRIRLDLEMAGMGCALDWNGFGFPVGSNMQ